MHLVKQTRHGNKNGNCLPACVASMTGLSIEAVDFDCHGKDWLAQYNDMMIHKYSKWLFPIDIVDHKYMRGAYIAIGKSANNPDCDHAVLWKNGEIFFEPAGRYGKGLKGEPSNFIVILNHVE